MNTPEKPFRGGRVFTDDDAPIEQPKPRRLRFPCFAEGCPMPGTLWPGVTQGGAGDRPGTCAWHYGIVPTDIPKVTQVLNDWMCVSAEINQARQCLSGPLASDPVALHREFDAAWFRLQPLVDAWEKDLAPSTIRTGKGADTGYRQAYSDWAKHLERFIGARVVEVLSTRRPTAGASSVSTTQPRTVDEELPWQ